VVSETSTAPGGGVGSAFATVPAAFALAAFAGSGARSDLQEAKGRRSAKSNRGSDRRFIGFISKDANNKERTRNI
jgi:hypothetical protein